jgi:hypothetical protein
MANGINPEDLEATLREGLSIYAKEVQASVDACGKRAMRKLVQRTRETAPVGKRQGQNFAASIASKEEKGVRGSRFIWFVKAPNYRLTHLLVKGHATKDGGRTKPDPFLANALDEVLPTYEKEIEEELKK